MLLGAVFIKTFFVVARCICVRWDRVTMDEGHRHCKRTVWQL